MLIATAGHIDHGKTSLVKQLTGTDTDRLPQEKARGVSIDLGFAYDTLDSDAIFGFVDVPGHEKFIRNMLAGVASVQAVMLVIAADDGPMPQTLEHLAILDLLGFDNAVIAITKIDRVDSAQLELVKQQVLQLISETSLCKASILPVSATTGDGIDRLKEHLRQLRQQLRPRPSNGRFRLPVDREFSLAGIGSVVTGAVVSGSVRAGDELTLAPHPQQVRVRSLHVQDRAVDAGTAAMVGDRCALNLVSSQTMARRAVRGDWLMSGPAPEATFRFDAIVRVLASEARALRHWTPVHLHHGASTMTARIAPLQTKEIAAGESGLAQLVLDQPAIPVRGDRFIIRDQSARRTIGGGEVLDSFGPGKGRSKPARIACLLAMRSSCAETVFEALSALEPSGIDVHRFSQTWNLTGPELQTILDRLEPVLLTLQDSSVAIARSRWQALQSRLLAALADWHQQYPEQFGPSPPELRQASQTGSIRVIVDACIEQLVRGGQIVRIGTSLKLPSHEPHINEQDQQQWLLVSHYLQPDQLKPPVVSALAESLSQDPASLEVFLRRCSLRGQLIKVTPNRYFHPHAIARLAEIAAETAKAQGGAFHVKALRDAAGIGRNLSIEVLEYFDTLGFTRRLGDSRHIIRSAAEVFGQAAVSGDQTESTVTIEHRKGIGSGGPHGLQSR